MKTSVSIDSLGKNILTIAIVLFLVYLTQRYNYLLFHSLAEIFCVIIACAIFMIVWNSKDFIKNNYILVLGTAYLFIGSLDMIHMLSYRGMGIFTQNESNLPTQIWIAARYMESLSFLAASFFVTGKLKIHSIFWGYLILFSVLLVSIFFWPIFPDCFVEGIGLTHFKKISEYIICLILMGSLILLFQQRHDFDSSVFKYLSISIVLTIVAELFFTFYISVYGVSNLVGHLLKIISFYLIYKAIIETSLKKPYALMFKELSENEFRYKKAQRMGKVGNWEFDLETEHFWGSDEAKRIYGFDPQAKNFTADEVENCIPERKRIHQALLDLLEKGTPYDLEFEIRPVTGPPKKIVRSIAEVITNDSGASSKIAGVIQDISQQQKTKEEKEKIENRLIQAQKVEAVGTLAGGIAHDFNNILYPIIGFAELSIEVLPNDHPVRENLLDILHGAKRARDLVKQILAYTSHQVVPLAPVSLEPLVQDALKLLRSLIPADIKIQQDLWGGSAPVLCNPSEINEIVMNLCVNAYHAMENTGGVITVCLKKANPARIPDLPDGDYCCLSVQDTGTGISPEIVNTIFDPYFTTKELGKGSGLGLSVVHGIVKKYKGAVTVENKPGKGSIFNVYFPLALPPSNDSPGKERPPIGNEKILFVDDEKAIVKLGTQLLGRLGYEVTGKESSLEALAVFQSAPNDFDLVITDMTMPDMVGTNFAKKLMAIRPEIPIILCTGFSDRVDSETTAAIGFKGYINKPISSLELSLAVRRILDQSTY